MIDDLKENLTQKIFAKLKDARFLCVNSPIKEEKRLYEYIEKEEKSLVKLFRLIGYELKIGNGYAYFASQDSIESKMEKIYEFLEILSFLFELDTSFGVGYRFNLDEIERRVRSDETLKFRLEKMLFLKNGQSIREKIEMMVMKLEKSGFIALENSFERRYLVLSSFEYLLNFFEKIEIKNG